MVKKLFWGIEDFTWNLKCSYNLWLHGPYGLAKVIEKMPFRFIIKYLRKYGATIGKDCRFERGINIHRPFGKKPFENLVIGNNVYLGHDILIDLSRRVTIMDYVLIGSNCQLWTHTGCYKKNADSNSEYTEIYGEINIYKYAIIYSKVLIIPGITIGNFSKIAACSLVNKNVDSNIFVGGVPAIPVWNKR